MRLSNFNPELHRMLSNVLPDQHHLEPYNIEVSNTVLSVSPLPGGPGVWDISIPFDTHVIKFAFRSNWTCAEGSGKAGVVGFTTRNGMTEATAISTGGNSTIARSAYNAVYSKAGNAMNLSHKVFDSILGSYICLTDTYLVLIDANTRVLRTTWTNFGSSYYTLNVWGEVQIIG